MARKATWQCHADPRECLRGTGDVIFILTRISMIIVHISIRYIGFTLTPIISSPYIPMILHLFLRVGLCPSILFDRRLCGVTWSVESTAR